MDETETSAHEVYEEIAAGLDDRKGNESVRRTHGEWQATRELVPDVAGERVLDAACGTGHFTACLVERGADAVGVDASEASVERARERLGDRARFCVGDLTAGVPFESSSFGFVSCLLAVEHVDDWPGVCAEFARVLEPGGRLLVSTDHPFTTYHTIANEPDDVGSATARAARYYDVERYEREWGDVTMPCYRRPLSALLAPLTETNLLIDAVREPEPTARTEHTEYFLDGTPRFVVLRARLPDNA